MHRDTMLASALLILAACGGNPPAPPVNSGGSNKVEVVEHPTIPAHVADACTAGDRSDDDKKLDDGRKPAEMLAFFGIAQGAKVAELMAGTGYTSELLARTVGSSGTVFGQNTKMILEKFAGPGWAARLGKPINGNIVRVDAELEAPFPPIAKELDAVLMVLIYHDTVWMNVDRARMNLAVFAALKKGGVYGIVDHSGRVGTGTSEANTVHRIEEKVVRDEVQKAGFVLAAEATFLRNPEDARDWNPSPMAAKEKRGTSDRFVLKFVKP